MLKYFLNFFLVFFIIFFFYFVFDYYFSKKNLDMLKKNRTNIKMQNINIENLPVLENNTSKSIEFNSGYNEMNKKKYKRNFWELFKN